MLDMNFLPDISGFLQSPGVSDIQVFTGFGSNVSGLEWQTWRKPRGKTMCNILCIGSGGGGGGGFTGVSLGAGGGGGGGSSGVTRITLPLYFMPDTLYLQVVFGGAGGTGSGVAGTGGTRSYVNIYPFIAPTNCYGISGAASPGGGAAGTNAGSAAAGIAGTIAVIADMPLAGLGHFDMIAGQIGATGGIDTGANGSNGTVPTTSVVTMGGSGGAGVITAGSDFAGGGISALGSVFQLSNWCPVATAAGGNPGSAGGQLWKPLWSYPGLGGGGSVAGSGGAGGPGAYGSGGGGGGGGNVAGGAGGDGGSGLVIITCW